MNVVPAPAPCTPPAIEKAKCDVLLAADGPFAACADLPSLQEHYQSCLMDACNAPLEICTTLQMVNEECTSVGHPVGDYTTATGCGI